jgi:hypothetical protein
MTDSHSDEEVQLWNRRIGSQANNRGWTLAEQPTRTEAEDEEMLDAAHASRHLWRKIGNERNVARADLLLGQVHALLGLSRSAMAYAEAALSYFTSQKSELWELAFAHAIVAHAAHGAGQLEMHRTYYAKALEIAEAISAAEVRKVFDASFCMIPKPTGARNEPLP